MDAATTVAEASLAMLVLGAGIGLVMQVLVIAVQNAVDSDDLGVATSGAPLFRLIGGALGTAAFGALFAWGLTRHLAAVLPAVAADVGAGTEEVFPMPTDASSVARIDEGRAELARAGLVETAETAETAGASGDQATAITPRGREALARLVTARQEHLSEILHEWSPEGRDRLTAALERIAHELEEV